MFRVIFKLPHWLNSPQKKALSLLGKLGLAKEFVTPTEPPGLDWRSSAETSASWLCFMTESQAVHSSLTPGPGGTSSRKHRPGNKQAAAGLNGSAEMLPWRIHDGGETTKSQLMAEHAVMHHKWSTWKPSSCASARRFVQTHVYFQQWNSYCYVHSLRYQLPHWSAWPQPGDTDWATGMSPRLR